jgi:DNA-directed RNA polymerase specialized sigma24 family protein
MIAPDGELLRRYAEERSEEAFADLVRRHVDLVYSAALRQVNGDAHLAQDVAQMVFTELSRRAAPLSRRPMLAGWLYTCAHFCAAKAVRSERRRHSREQAAMHELFGNHESEPDWEKILRCWTGR